jgi:hypothetical protein
MCVTVTVVIGHSMALCRCPHLFSTMSSLHDVLVHDTLNTIRHSSSTWQGGHRERYQYPPTCSAMHADYDVKIVSIRFVNPRWPKR